ncbi:FAD-dependent oxidoreductase [Gordonia sp. NB41Y]|uniref:FAD-dependent oxidoreductase n=1 Tax=Gordonia sp. NB41Y TaxID=875808 RepID=UPI00273CF269|nr:FAD-dependent oxidoreductase [Gordonia sp. NB41Y]WLP91062.1 FAD-dependent oxidoreductase [Gordonia sp. NB41Y]
MSARIAVVGAGVSGLVAALRLRQALGDDAVIDILEAGESTGGILQTVEVGGRPVDVGAEAFIVRRPEAVDLVAELGLTDRVVAPTGARPAIWANGGLHPLPSPALMGIPASADIVAGIADPADVDRIRGEADRPLSWRPGTDVSVGELVADRFGPSVVARCVDPMLGGVYSSLAGDIGLREALPALALRLDQGATSLTGAVTDILAASTGTGPVFGTLVGGYRVLLDALVDAARPTVHLGARVTGLSRTGDRWAVHGPVEATYDGVILAVPAWIAGELLATQAPDLAPTLRAVEPASSVVLSLALAPGTDLPAHSGVLVATGEDLHAKAFTLSSRKWAHLGRPDRPVSVRASFGRYGAPIADDALDSLRGQALADLDRICAAAGVAPASGHVIDVWQQRWTGGLPRYAPGHLARMAEVLGHRPTGLALAGSSYAGVGVPACIGQAGRAARDLLTDLH